MLPGKKLSLTDILTMVRRRAWLLVIPPLVTTFFTLMYARTLKNTYQSDMLISIVPQRVPDSFVRSTVTMRIDERLGAVTVQVLSRTNLEQLIEEFNLYPEARASQPLSDVVAHMKSSILVEPERPRPGPRGPEGPSAFHVKFTYTDPAIAAQVTQRLGTLFIDTNAKDRGALAGATDQFLSTKLAESRERLEVQERKLEAFRARHGAALPSQSQANMQAVQTTQMQVQATVESLARDRDRKMLLERLYNEARNEPLPVTVPPPAPASGAPAGTVPVGASAQQRLDTLRAELAAAEMRLKPEHPDVVRLRRQIADLEPKAAAEQRARAAATPDSPVPVAATTPEEAQRRERLRQMAAELESIDRQIRFKEAEEQRLRTVVSEYQRRIDAVPGLESEWSALTRDYETLREQYKDLLNKSEASKVAMDLEEQQIGERFRIVDPAGVPVRPISSARVQVNGAGFVLGLLLGLGIAALLELRDRSFRSEADVLDVLSLPVLAVVPLVHTAADVARKKRIRLAMSGTAAVVLVGAAYVAWTLKLWNSVY